MSEFKKMEITPVPTALNLRTQSKLLEISFDDGAEFVLSFEMLRVYSPSAEVRGHGVGQEILQTGKRGVNISAVEPVGNYAIRPIFSDGHDSGLYSWDYLYWLGSHQDDLWESYLTRLRAEGYPEETGRDVPMKDTNAGGHGHH